MLITYSEKNEFVFEGTIIDLETIGDFCNYNDSRYYHKIIPIILGYINKDELKIVCAKGEEAIAELKKQSSEIIRNLERPFFGYNCCFEMGVLFHSLGLEVKFDGDLMKEKVAGVKWEKKQEAVTELGIPKYDDPFNGNGKHCSSAWLKGEWKKAIKHNRSCLLTERDILLRRGYSKPDLFVFHSI
jgi:hypothetical protein